MAQEIERKFLVKGDFLGEVCESHHIVQGYLNSSKGRTVRVRVKDSQAYITVKGPSLDGGLSRYEWEMEIPLEDANALMELAEPTPIAKTRHIVRSTGSHPWEIDVFEGANAGLIIAEIELKSVDEDVELPGWLGQEVTGDRRYYNSYLSNHPFTTW
ncbi:MAG: CYTH domain-containing protein [Bacteroidales bacterium]|nr:CYTH domain-containing protein [Bacteroidales bacterium]MBO7480147.1 CYTH domain-containing protein [Bacteroidales bacterium]MBO7488192.1 CYTH domain-containing protein [Bacteroidales bacterium]